MSILKKPLPSYCHKNNKILEFNLPHSFLGNFKLIKTKIKRKKEQETVPTEIVKIQPF